MGAARDQPRAVTHHLWDQRRAEVFGIENETTYLLYLVAGLLQARRFLL
jgi:hypothetical protein